MDELFLDGDKTVDTLPENFTKNTNPDENITLSPFYHSSVNEITQPERYVAMSRYFVRRWQAELGPTGVGIVLHLRAECFWNPKTRELRDTTQTTIKKIADGIGVSDKTVRREFADNKVLVLFVRVRHEFTRDNKRGGYRMAPSTYQVSMDDPLHPADDLELIIIIRRKAEEADKGNRGSETALDRARRESAHSGSRGPEVAEASPQPASGQIGPVPPEATSGQNDRTQSEVAHRPVDLAQDVDKLPPASAKMTAPSGQNDRTLNHYSETTEEITTTTESDTQAGAEEEAGKGGSGLEHEFDTEPDGFGEVDQEYRSEAGEQQDIAPLLPVALRGSGQFMQAANDPNRLGAVLVKVVPSLQVPGGSPEPAALPRPTSRLEAAMQAAATKLDERLEDIFNTCNDLWEQGYKSEEVACVLSDATTVVAQDKRDGKIKVKRADGQSDVARYLRGVLKRKMDTVRAAPPPAKTYTIDWQTLQTLVPSHPADAAEVAAEFVSLPLMEQEQWLEVSAKYWATQDSRNKTMIRITAVKKWWAFAYPEAAKEYQAVQDAKKQEAAKRDAIRRRGL